MVQQKIQLRKLRDFGDNFSDTFQFLRQEFKPLMTSFLLIGGIFMLASAIFAAFFQQQAWGLVTQLMTGITTAQPDMTTFLTPGYYLMILVSVLTLSAMRTVIAVYMDYYDQHNASPSVGEVWQGFVQHIPLIFFFSIIRTVLIIVGVVLCLAPGVYLLVVLMPYSFVAVSERTSFGEVFNRCFELVKENFWISFAVYLIAFLIFSVSSGIVGFMASLIAGLASYFTTREVTTTVPIVAGVMNLVEYVFYIVFFISAGLQYYNLVETRDGTGLARRLENLGSAGPDNRGMEEQY